MSWMAFVEGFARGTTDIIEKNEAKAEEYADRMREQAERNKGRFAQMQQAVKQNEAFVLRAKALGASDSQISMALDSGPQGLMNMVTDLGNLQAEMGENYTPEIAGLRYSVPEDYTSTNIDVASRYFPGGTVGDVEEPSGNFFRRLYGKDAMAQTRADLDRELVEGTGVSIFDMAALTEEQLYQSLNPSVLIAPGDVRFMDADTTNSAKRDYQQAVTRALEYANTTYDSEVSQINTMYAPQMDGSASLPGINDGITKDQALQAAREKRDGTVRNAIRAHFASQTGIIGYEEAMLAHVRDLASGGADPYHQYAVELLEGGFSADTGAAPEDADTGPSQMNFEPEGSSWQTNIFTVDAEVAGRPVDYDPVGQRVYYIEGGQSRSMSLEQARRLARDEGGQFVNTRTGQAITDADQMTVEQTIKELDQEMLTLAEYIESGLFEGVDRGSLTDPAGNTVLDGLTAIENELERLATVRANILNREVPTVATQEDFQLDAAEASGGLPQVSQEDQELIAGVRQALEDPDLTFGELGQIALSIGAKAPGVRGTSEERILEYRANIEAALREMIVPNVPRRPELPGSQFTPAQQEKLYGETPAYKRVLEEQAAWDAQYGALYNEDGTPKPNHPGLAQ